MRQGKLVSVVLLACSLGAVQLVAQNLTPAAAVTPAAGSSAGVKADAQPGAAANTSTDTKTDFLPRNPRYALRTGDTFDVNFELSPEFNQSVTVQPDGYITLKGVGDVRVVGETVPELTQTLHNEYGKILNDPLIAVVLKDFDKPYFTASGQLNHPGKYELRGNITLTEAVAIAGGFNGDAKHSQVLLFRRVNDQWLSAKLFNVKQMMKDGKLTEDPVLRPGDQIFVPKTLLSKIKPFIPNAGVGAYGAIAP
jgi:polysaccharide biosynthesis/export protein